MTFVPISTIAVLSAAILLWSCSRLLAVQPVSQPTLDALRFAVDAGPKLPQGRGGHAAGLVGGHLIVVGGNEWNASRTEKIWHADALILEDGHWTAGPSLPNPLAYPAFAEAGNRLVLAGGTDGKKMRREAYILSWSKKLDIQPLPPLPTAFDAGACAVVGDTVYVLGGEIDKGLLGHVLKLDLAHLDHGWQTCAPLPGSARAYSAVLTQGPLIYLIGGVSNWSPLTCHHDVFCYDTARDRWSVASNLELPGYAWSASPVDASHFLLAARASGVISDGIWLVSLPGFSMRQVGRSMKPTATAPLVRLGKEEWWLIGGEPDSDKHRTPIVSRIRLMD